MQSGEHTQQASIAVRIVAGLAASAREATVAEVRIGLGYTAVLLTDKSLGVAYTFREEARGGCSVFDRLRPLSGRPACDLLTLLKSTDAIEAGVGLACANALANKPRTGFTDGDILDYLDLGPTDDVGMVGHFGPLVGPVKERARSLTIFERVKEPHGDMRPSEEATELLPQCHVALVTATSIINHTIDSILRSAGKCREVAVLGASTPMLPEAFAAENVTLVSGVMVKNPGEVLRVISEGGGMRLFSLHVSKVCLRIKHSQDILTRKG